MVDPVAMPRLSLRPSAGGCTLIVMEGRLSFHPTCGWKRWATGLGDGAQPVRPSLGTCPDQRHGLEAERLFDALIAAYARQDAYAPVQRGRLMYHAPSLIEAAGGASWWATSDHE